jgi:hypothetical protein
MRDLSNFKGELSIMLVYSGEWTMRGRRGFKQNYGSAASRTAGRVNQTRADRRERTSTAAIPAARIAVIPKSVSS